MKDGDNMVERVARALWESEPDAFGWSASERRAHRSWDDAVVNGCYGVGVFRKFARAAIAAMRDHMEAKHGNSSRYFHEAFLIATDAALKEDGP